MAELPTQAFRSDPGGTLLRCHVQPGAKRAAVVGSYGDRVKLALDAPPVDGKANARLCRLLADWCGVAASRVALRSGLTGRDKTVFVAGVSAAELNKFLLDKMK